MRITISVSPGSIAGSTLDFSEPTAPTITATYQYDPHYHAGLTETFFFDGSGDPKSDVESGDLTAADLVPAFIYTLEMRYYPELPAWVNDNDWHNAIRMAYANPYRPGAPVACVPGTDCLVLPEESGEPDNIASLLVIAGEHDWVDDECAPTCDGLADELSDVFDNGNNDNDGSFYNRRSINAANSTLGNDEILVIQ